MGLFRLRRAGSAERARRVLAALASAAPLSGAARAGDAPEVRHTTPPVVVEAMRPAELPEDPSSFTTVIEMDDYRGESTSVEEILADSVGVQVRRFGGRGDPSEISIRGSTAQQVVVLLDGIRLNTAQTGGVDLSSIPRELIERIEISRGGGSVRTGSDAIGGVVNLVTRRPGGRPRTALSAALGSFDSYEGSATQQGTWRDLELSLGYSGFASDGDWDFQAARREADGVRLPSPSGSFERINNESQNHSALLRIARDLGDRGRLELGESFFYASDGVPGPDAGGGALLGQSPIAQQRRTRNVADLRLSLADLHGVDAEARVFHRFDRSRFRDRKRVFPVASDNRNQALGGRLSGERSWRLGPTRHRASLGGELRRDRLDSRDFPNAERRTLGVFAQDDASLFEGRLRIVPALRLDDSQGFDAEWIPRLGVIVRPLPWLELKGNVERSYRVPNFDELFFDEEFVRGNPALEPEDSFDADIGLELGFERLGPASDLWLEVVAFRRDVEESIVFQLVSQFVVAATNTGDATIEGLELGGGFRLLDWLAFSGNWTRLDAEVDASGLPLPGRPQSESLLRVEIGPPGGPLRLVGERSHTSSIPVTPSGRTRVSSREVYDLALILDLARLPRLGRHVPGESLLLSLTARNVGDVSVRDAQFFPQPGRSLSFRVEWRR